MTRKTLLALIVLSASVASAQDLLLDRPRAVDYLGESGGALLGGSLVGGAAVAALGWAGYALTIHDGSDFQGEDGAWLGFMVGAGLGYPSGCGLGATIAGGVLHVDGNSGAAYGGAFLGMGVGALGFFVPDKPGYGLLGMAALTPAGAAIGYCIGATRGTGEPSFGSRFYPPALALSARPSLDHQPHTVVDCRLVTMRF
ncbi:MAG TPA: hypothetical protein VMH22_01590 [bacterium]|nr:hypothetical protein [bacterium]